MRIEWDELNKIDILRVANNFEIDTSKRNTYCFKGHDEKTPSLYFSPDKNSWYCFGCDIGGGPIQLVQEVMGLDKLDAAKWLTNNYLQYKTPLITSKKYQYNKKENFNLKKKLASPDHEIYEWILSESPLNKTGLSYLINTRGFNQSTIDFFKIGEINKLDELFNDLIQTWGYERVFKSGLIKQYQDKNNKTKDLFLWNGKYLIIPFFKDNQVIYIQGRALTSKKLRYLGLRGIEKPLFNISILEDLEPGESIYICEGVFDAMAAYQYGLNSVAILGASSFNKDWVVFFKKFKVCVIHDNDKAGIKSYNKIKNLFASYGKITNAIEIGDHKDLADYLKANKNRDT